MICEFNWTQRNTLLEHFDPGVMCTSTNHGAKRRDQLDVAKCFGVEHALAYCNNTLFPSRTLETLLLFENGQKHLQNASNDLY